MIDPYMIGTGVIAVVSVIGWGVSAGRVKALRGDYDLLKAINEGILLRNEDLRDVIYNLEVDLVIAKAELRSAKAILDARAEGYRLGQAKSTASKAKARAEKVAKTLADLPAALAPMDVAA